MKSKLFQTTGKIIFILSLAFLLFTWMPTAVLAADVSLSWNPVSPAPLGYRLYMRTEGKTYNYSSPAWTGTATSRTLTGLANQTRYYFVVRAYNATSESSNSNEVSTLTGSSTTALAANAGADSTVSSGTRAYLNGSGAGSIASYRWVQTSGPSVTISNATAAQASFTAPSATTNTILQFRLTVSNSAGSTSSDTCQVTVLPASLDSDKDGLSDADEAVHKTDPNKADTDGDGVLDGAEVQAGTNPLDTPSTPANSDLVIIDDASSATSKTGVWEISSSTDAYDPNSPYDDSLWARGGNDTFTWRFKAPRTGKYQVWEWHSSWSSRTSAAPFVIGYNGGSKKISVNQKLNGGKWNSLGTYSFVAGTTYNMTLTSVADSSSTCADALRFTFVP